jgi:hypothetical protein
MALSSLKNGHFAYQKGAQIIAKYYPALKGYN